MESRRKTLIEAMSKFQDAKKSVLFQYLSENREEDIFTSSCIKDSEGPSLGNFRNENVPTQSDEDRNYCSNMIRQDICSRDTPSTEDNYEARDEKAGSEKNFMAKRKLAPDPEQKVFQEKGNCIAPSLILSEKRQPHRSNRTTSDKSTLQEVTTSSIQQTKSTPQQVDASSTQGIQNPPSRIDEKHYLNFLHGDDAPSDESSRDDDKGNHKTPSPISEEMSQYESLEGTDHQIGMENTVTRSASNSSGDQTKNRNGRRGKYEIEDKFLKLFVDEEAPRQSRNADERNVLKSERTRDGVKDSREDVSEGLRGHTRDNVLVGEHDDSPATTADDPMSLLEKKLNMMISKKPLWQKALQDLSDDPFDSKISMSTTSSVITKPPSEATTICSVDTRVTMDLTTSNHQLQVNEKKNTTDSGVSIKHRCDRIQDGNNTQDVDSLTATDTTIESWRVQSVCSIDLPDPPGEKKSDDSKTDLNIEKAFAPLSFEPQVTALACSNTDILTPDLNIEKTITTDGTSAAESDTIESQHTQKAKDYLDTLPECLSDLPEEGSITGEKRNERPEKETDCMGETQIEADIKSLRIAVSECTDTQGAEQIQSHSSLSSQSSMNGEKSKVGSEIEKDRVENLQGELYIGSLQGAKSDCIVAPSLDEQQMLSKHTDQQILHSMALQSNLSDYIVAPSMDEQQMLSNHPDIQFIHSMNLQSNEQIEVEFEPTRIAKRTSLSPLDEEQIIDDLQPVQSINVQMNQWEMTSPAFHLKTPPTSNIRKHFITESDKFGDSYLIQQQNEIIKQFFAGSDNFDDSYLSQNQNETTPKAFDQSDKSCDTNMLQQDLSSANPLTYFDWGVTSDLSDDSTISHESSTSSACSAADINNDDAGNDNEDEDDNEDEKDDIGENDGVDDNESVESSMKPPIPNEVTMLTDFTVQSIAYTSNNSALESLGEESIVEETQMDRKPSNYYVGTSNSESTVILERNNKEQNESALQVDKLDVSCTEGLLKIVKNPILLCQCTGPVALNDVIFSNPKDV